MAHLDARDPFLFPSDLIRLVELVLSADESNESVWLEWKGEVDLDKKDGWHHIPKHVLGFANRDVETARTAAGGYGYLVVGAEPGHLVGVKPVDPATLHPRIQSCIGDVVRYRAEYVSVQDNTVLVVIVDPPKHGDPIYPVRGTIHSKHDRGVVLVRNPGQTAPATDHQIDLLVARARAGRSRVNLDVVPDRFTLEALPPLLDGDIDALVEAEREATLARPDLRGPEPKSPPSAALAAAMASFDQMSLRDRRGEDDYEAEVAGYVESYRFALWSRYLWRLWHHGTWLQFTAVNTEDKNLHAVRLQVHLGGAVEAWPDPDDIEDITDFTDDSYPCLPERPAVLGTPRPPLGASLLGGLGSHINFATTAYDPGPGYSIRTSGSVEIEFDTFALRPLEREPQDAVPLVVTASPGTELVAEWTATATNVDGQLTGHLSFTVVESTIDKDELLRLITARETGPDESEG